MNVMIALPPEIESRLRGAASRCGMDVGACAAKLIVEHVPAPQDLDAKVSIEDDEGVRPLRGFMPIQPERGALFTQEVTTDLPDPPKWKPHVDFTRRVLSEVDDG
jgi:hypothetical protein